MEHPTPGGFAIDDGRGGRAGGATTPELQRLNALPVRSTRCNGSQHPGFDDRSLSSGGGMLPAVMGFRAFQMQVSDSAGTQ